MICLWINGDMMNDEPIECKKEECIVGVISITSLLRDLILIKKYAIEKNDERIYLCADNVEQQLNKLRYNNSSILDKDW